LKESGNLKASKIVHPENEADEHGRRPLLRDPPAGALVGDRDAQQGNVIDKQGVAASEQVNGE
jgi:hypothetical protein